MIGIVDSKGNITILHDNAPCTINGVQYPEGFFQNMSWTEQEKYGRYPVVPSSTTPGKFQVSGEPTYKFVKSKKQIFETLTVHDLPLDTIKQQLIAEVKQMKETRTYSPIVVTFGTGTKKKEYVFDMSPVSQQKIAGAMVWALSGNLPAGFTWRVDDKAIMDANALQTDPALVKDSNVDVPLDATRLTSLGNQVAAHVHGTHNIAVTHKKAITALKSVAKAKAYDVSLNWPTIYTPPNPIV